MNDITIKEIIKEDNRIEIKYKLNGEWKKYFKDNEDFYIEYNRNIENVPDNVCVIPFLSNILPIIWINDATIYLEELDKAFYECIENVKKGYIDMFPNIEFKGEIKVKNIIENKVENSANVVTFFSGGIDSFSTLIGHINEKPQIITIWGSDVSLNDTEGWDNVREHVELVAKEFNIKSNLIKTNFRTFINEEALNNLVWKKAKDRMVAWVSTWNRYNWTSSTYSLFG